MALLNNLPLFHPLVVSLINVTGVLLIAAVVIRNKLSDKLASTFTIMGLLMFCWIDFAYLARVMGANNLFWAEIFLRMAWVATPPFFAYVYLITVHMLFKAKQLAVLNTVLVTIALLLSASTAFTDFIIKGVAFSGSNLDIVYGPGFLPFLGIISLYIVATLLPLFTAKLEAHRKKRVRIFLLGVLFFYAANLIFNITLPAFLGITHLYYFGDYSLIFLVGLTAYSIIRYRLLDIRTLIFRSVAFTILTSVFFVGFGLASYWALAYLDYLALSNTALAVLGAISVALAIPTYGFYRRRLVQLTDKYLFQSKSNYRAVLVKVSQRLSRTINIDEVTKIVLNTMQNSVRASSTVIFLKDQNGDNFVPRAWVGRRDLSLTIPVDHALLRHFHHSAGPLVSDELLAFIEEEGRASHKKELQDIRDAMQWMNASMVIPLYVDKGLTGVILLDQRISGEPYTQEDVEFLAALAPQAATALENARLYQESLEFTEKLKVEVERATHELEVANRQLQDLDKAKSEFLSIASHQLYTPLTALRGYISMLQEGDYGSLSVKQQPVLDILNKSATRLIDLIKNLLDISRIESGRLELNLESVDLAQLAKELVQDLLPNALSKDLDLEFKNPPEKIARVVVDRERLRQVMLNFIDNSIKYTERGRVDVGIRQEVNELVFSVTDTGKGISQEELTKLFTKFTRVGGSSRFHTEGTGLGLYVARQIVREHHGEVDVKSPGVGHGSTFEMRIPVEGSPNSLRLGERATVVIKAAEARPQPVGK